MISTRSVRLKIVLGFVAVMAPLVAFLFYNNYYAMSVVRDQVSTNYSNLLDQYVKNTDNIMQEVNMYLYRMENDTDVSILYAYGYNSDEYVLNKIRVLNKFNSGIGYYNVLSAFFLYSPNNDDLILSSQDSYSDYYRRIREQLARVMELKKSTPNYNWMIVKSDNANALVQIYPLNPDLYAGAWINVKALVQPLSAWDLGNGGGVILDTPDGPLTGSLFPTETYNAMKDHVLASGRSYRIVADPADGKTYLLVEKKSELSGIRFIVAIPETNLLQKLPYFQRAVYMIPLVGVIAVALYLLFLQRIFFKPLADLIRGMRRIGQGKLDFRLQPSGSTELNFMSATFNDMAAQIEKLKIDVYEEELKVQQAEFKHLQVQINPHFYMNSLNIVYNLAALKDYKSVQKMALHLADYFRFTIRTNRTTVTLREELQHVRNYLEIQQLRYPDLLEFRLEVPDDFLEYPIPPLTIQPFVENSVIHGFDNRGEPFRIAVSAEKAGGGAERWRIVIADNGKGFSPEMLEKMQGDEWMRSTGEEHLGIWNVIRRLKLYVGPDAQVTFANAGARGAMVTLHLPIHPKGEDQKEAAR